MFQEVSNDLSKKIMKDSQENRQPIFLKSKIFTSTKSLLHIHQLHYCAPKRSDCDQNRTLPNAIEWQVVQG